jgi:hypothetical protein
MKRRGRGSGLGRGWVPGGGAGEGFEWPARAGHGEGGCRSGGVAAHAGWNKGRRVWTGPEKGKWAGPSGIEEFLIYSKEFQKEVT